MEEEANSRRGTRPFLASVKSRRVKSSFFYGENDCSVISDAVSCIGMKDLIIINTCAIKGNNLVLRLIISSQTPVIS